MKKKTKFCGECGRVLIQKLEPAEWHDAYNDGVFSVRYDKYDPETGERQWVTRWECPNKRRWNSHDRYPVKLV